MRNRGRNERESVNVISKISAELDRERQKNAERMQRIHILEAQIQEKENEPPQTNGQGSCSYTMERDLKKFKRQKIEHNSNTTENSVSIVQTDFSEQKKPHTRPLAPKDSFVDDRLINWMSMEETQVFASEKPKDGDSTAECDNTDDSDDEDYDYRVEDDVNNDHKEEDSDEISRLVDELKYEVKGSDAQCEELYSGEIQPEIPNVDAETYNELSTGPDNEVEIKSLSKIGPFKVPI